MPSSKFDKMKPLYSSALKNVEAFSAFISRAFFLKGDHCMILPCNPLCL